MKDKRKSGLKILLGVAAFSAAVLCVLCVVFFVPVKDSGKTAHGSSKFTQMASTLRMIVYAAEFPQPDGMADVSLSSATIEPDIDPKNVIFETILNDSNTTASIALKGLSEANKITIAVWSENDGQDDIVWYDPKKDAMGVFECEIPIKNHHTEGVYKAEAYVIRSDESKYIIGTTTFSIEGPSLQNASFENVNSNSGTFQINIERAISKSVAKHVKVKVYPVSAPKNSCTYEADLSEDGMAVIEGSVSNHGYISGDYCGEVTIIDGNEIQKKLSQITTNITLPQMSISQNMNTQNTVMEITVANLIENSVSKMDIEVYSKSNGKDDLVSYPATAMSASSYKANAVISNHHTAGEYEADIYGVRGSGKRELLGSVTFNVAAPNAGSVSVASKNEEDEYFKTVVGGASSAAGISQIRLKIVRESDGNESWLEAISPSTGNAEFTVDVKNQTDSVDTYSVTGYVKDTNGIEVATNTVSVSMTQLQNGKYKIMGQTRTSVAQMVRYFNANGKYPSYYANTEAPNIEAFCQIFYDEAVAEGVKAEVAFCQTMKETGYLKFGGDVSISQFNFAGIGATGNGAPGNSFSSVTEGIRAQIQHLKAYASTGALNKACVDPRFAYVKRGSAVYVEWLGIKENPEGGGWAAGEGYGPSIVNSYIRKLFSY